MSRKGTIVLVLTFLVLIQCLVTESLPAPKVSKMSLEVKTDGKQKAKKDFKDYPNTDLSSLEFREGDILHFSFVLEAPSPPQQVFLSFSHPELSTELVFVAHSSSATYTLVVVRFILSFHPKEPKLSLNFPQLAFRFLQGTSR